MALTREKKEQRVREIGDILASTDGLVFASFSGITVAEVNDMRRDFRDRGVGYKVVKKSLLDRALGAREIDGERPGLEGELAIAYPTEGDSIAPAKAIADYQKKLEERIAPLGGIFESRYIAREQVAALAAIPPREVLYGQFATVINAPIQQTVQALSGVASSFVTVLDQIAQQKA